MMVMHGSASPYELMRAYQALQEKQIGLTDGKPQKLEVREDSGDVRGKYSPEGNIFGSGSSL